MRCPYCRRDNDKVTDSRACEDSTSIRRRRQCVHCERRFTTYERVEEMHVKVVKKDGSLELFLRDKIRLGLEKACWKRPVNAEAIDSIVSAVESEVYNDFEEAIESRTLGELVMRHLVEVDQVAYVRFASVYREFTDVKDFVDELTPYLRSRAR